jgi:hypothetical protein
MKYRYTVDKNNQLLFQQPDKKKTIPVRGKFALTKTNQLIYFVEEVSSWRKKYGFSDIVRFKGECIEAKGNSLVFQITGPGEPSAQSFYLLKLSGTWFANEYNQLSFAVKKSGSPDVLTFQGEWELNRRQQVIYSYERMDLTRKVKATHTLIFEGFWEINSAQRLVYILSGNTDSRFYFRCQIQSPNLYPREGAIKYRLGVGLKGLIPKGAVPKIVCLYGAWKFSKKFGLNFEMDYGQGKIHAIEFGARVNLTKKNAVEFFLTNKRNELLGMNVTFTRQFLKKLDAQAFLRLKKLRQDSSIEAGLQIPF